MKRLNNLALTSGKKQQGFTLIELVVVIVILGILAVTAAPKFIDLTSDARESVMEGVEGSIESAISLVNAKALIDNELTATGEVEINGVFYALVFGFPAAEGVNNADGTIGDGFGITELVELDNGAGGDFITTDATPALFQHSGAPTVAQCQLSYADAADSDTRPQITATFTDC